jgi:ParB family transcriptional regulator, chromosome partitioning protein
MTNIRSAATLKEVRTDRIDRNPENPRVVFRSGELDDLLESIRQFGVQVPISVYRERGRFVLLDGERRWRCTLKLNHQTIPALVREKPGPLENLLLMFNIHALREQWDLLTIAMKLPRIVGLLESELGRPPKEAEIVERTGLRPAIIRRCKLLMALPEKYKEQILDELHKPKSKQRFTEDLFIEMERALTTVERAIPEAVENRDKVRRVLLKKYKKGIINNRVLFRQVARIARAERVGVDPAFAIAELTKLFSDNDYSIEEAYANSVGESYAERDIGTRIETLLGLLERLGEDDLEDDVRERLRYLVDRVSSFLGDA